MDDDIKTVASGVAEVEYVTYERPCRYCGAVFRFTRYPSLLPPGRPVVMRVNCDEHLRYRAPDSHVALRKGRGESKQVSMDMQAVRQAGDIVYRLLREAVAETGHAVPASDLVRRVRALTVTDQDIARSLGRFCLSDRQTQIQVVRRLRTLREEGRVGMDGFRGSAVWYPEAMED